MERTAEVYELEMEFLAIVEDTAAPLCLNTVMKHSENEAARPAGPPSSRGPCDVLYDWQLAGRGLWGHSTALGAWKQYRSRHIVLSGSFCDPG